MPLTVPEVLQALTSLTGIDQTGLAEVADVSQTTISNWLRGKQNPGKAEWDRIISHAAKNPQTAHLAQQYAIELLGEAGLHGFFDLAMNALKPPEPIRPAEPTRNPNAQVTKAARTNQERK